MKYRLALVSAALALSAGTAHAETVYVTADRLLEVETGKFVEKPLVTIVDGKIASVDAGASAPADGKVIDLAGHTLLPGLIDMHVHLDGRPEYGGYSSLQFTDRFATVLAVVNAEKMLKAGFTTVRNVGDGDYNVAGVDQAIEEGWIVGPRIVNGNYSLGATGGHCARPTCRPASARKAPVWPTAPTSSACACASSASMAPK